MPTLVKSRHIADRFVLDPSLVLYLPLHKLDGSSFMSRDRYGHLCTVTGATWTPQGRIFDGISNYISVPNIHGNLLTIIAWVKRNGVQNANANIVSQAFTTGNAPYYEFNLGFDAATLKPRFGVTTGGTFAPLVAANAIPDLTWIYLMGAYDGATQNLYINSIAETPLARTGDINNYGQLLQIGRWEKSAGLELKGTVGEAWIYIRALSAIEGQRNYLATKWRYQ